MKLDTTPKLDPRTSADIFDELSVLQPAWAPELAPAKGEASWALNQIFARFMQASIDRLNQAPDKNFLAYLDTFGVKLIPPKPSRAPVVFTPVQNAADSIIPARTRLAAKIPTQAAPLIFETEKDGAMTAAKLTDVITLWPAQDAYADHSSESAGKRAFELFSPLQPVRHEIYFAHETVLNFSGSSRIDLEFTLTPGGNAPIKTKWDFWDGTTWRPFMDIEAGNLLTGFDGTFGFTRSGILSLRAGCGESKATTVYGTKAHWIRGRVDVPLPPSAGRVLPQIDKVRLRSVITVYDTAPFPPDLAYADATKLDVSKVFYPFDQQPHLGSTFYMGSTAAFSKPGAQVRLTTSRAVTPAERYAAAGATRHNPTLYLEYWNGFSWARRDEVTSGTLYNFVHSGFHLDLIVPSDIAPTGVNEQQNWWIRIRIADDNFVAVQEMTVSSNTINVVTVIPPALEKMAISYNYTAPWMFPQACVTYNDFQWEVHSKEVRWPGSPFLAFRPVADATPTLYLGFDKPLPNDYVSIYLDIDEADAEGPPLVWEAWNGDDWVEISVAEETGRLSRPGMLSFVPPILAPRAAANITSAAATQVITGSPLDAALFKPGDSVVIEQSPNKELRKVDSVTGETITLNAPLEKTYTGGSITISALPRFGLSRDWIRARLKDDGLPALANVNGAFLNAVWVRQVETVTQEILGGGLGVPNQSFFLNKTPLLPGELIEIRELDGLRANVEYPILQEELTALGYKPDEIVTSSDPRSNQVTEVWVLWHERPHFYFSGPDDRHYVVERTSSRILFGDGVHGKLPPVGNGNIRARFYQAGGGLQGNVGPGQINQIMSGVLASSASNPRAGEGGADGETPLKILSRGPNVFRHMERSMSALDYETMAREASPAIAAVRVLPATASNGRPAAGSVTLIIVPQSQDPQPQPSYELRKEVHDFLALRAPCTVDSADISIKGPTYLPVGVSGILVPKDPSEAGSIGRAANAALAAYLHPLTGGPDGTGWAFGRDVYISDVASILEALSGVDHAEFLELRTDDTPVGDSVSVPPDRMVVAGPIRIEVRGS